MQVEQETYFNYSKISELLEQWELLPFNSISWVRLQLWNFWLGDNCFKSAIFLKKPPPKQKNKQPKPQTKKIPQKNQRQHSVLLWTNFYVKQENCD